MGSYIDDPANPVRVAELRWPTWVHDTVKQLGAAQPTTVGNCPKVEASRLTEPISDVLSFHPYWMWNSPEERPTSTKEGFERYLDECLAIAEEAGKGLIGNETVWGATDDAEHVEVMRYTLGELRKRGIGFTVHALHHSLIADLHRSEYGPVGWPSCCTSSKRTAPSGRGTRRSTSSRRGGSGKGLERPRMRGGAGSLLCGRRSRRGSARDREDARAA